jgi:hypothetical protein
MAGSRAPCCPPRAPRNLHSAHRVHGHAGRTRTPDRDRNPLPGLGGIRSLTYELTIQHTP